MSKKKDATLDDFELDDSLDEFDLDFPDPDAPDNRTPVTKVVSGVSKGVKQTLTDPGTIKTAIKNTFPKGFGQVIDESDRAKQALNNLYDESAKAVKPAVAQSKRLATKLISADSKMVPKALKDVLDKWRDEQEYERNSRNYGNVDRDALMAGDIAQIFEAQAEANSQRFAQTEAKDRLKEGVEAIRHKDSLSALNRIAMATSRVDQYTTGVANRYYRRSLELQYHNLNAIHDMTARVSEDSVKMREILAAIAKNTGLPDAIKATSKETLEEIKKKQLYQTVANGLFGERNQSIEGVITKVSKRIQDNVISATNGFMQGLTMVESGMDMAAGAGGDKIEMASDLIGGFATAQGVDYFTKKYGSKLVNSKLGKKLKLQKYGTQLEGLVGNSPRYIEEFRTSRKYQEDDSVKGKFLSLLQGMLPSNGIQSDIQYAGGRDLEQPYYVTKRSDRSINEVIPGYLARIWREIRVLRTGDNSTGLVLFDHSNGQFAGEGALTAKIKSRVIPESNVIRTQDELERIIAQVDPEGKLTEEGRSALRERLLINSTDNKMASRERLADPAKYGSSAGGQEAAAAMDRFFTSASQENLNKFRASHNDLTGGISDTRGIIQEYVESGNIRELTKLGLVDPDSKRINFSKIMEYYLAAPSSGQPGTGGPTATAPPGPTPTPAGPTPGGTPSASGFASTAKKAADKIRDIAKSAMQQTGSTAMVVAGKLPITQDIFVVGEVTPRITAMQIAGGTLRQMSTGNVVRRIDDLADDIIDVQGRVVMKAEEVAQSFMLKEGSNGYLLLSDNPTVKRALGTITETVRGEKGSASQTVIAAQKKAGSIIRQLATGPQGAGPLLLELAGKAKSVIEDVYVKGESTPRITAEEIKNGKILDDQGETVKDLSEVKSNLFDLAGKVRLRVEELEDAQFFNVRIAKWSPLGVGRSILGSLWHFQTRVAPGMAMRNLKRVWNAYAAVGKPILRATKWLMGMRVNNFPQDCYLKGEVHPVLFGAVMKNGGYFSVKAKKPIFTPAQIDGPLIDTNGQFVLTEEQYKQGLYNLEGRKISTTAFTRLVKAIVGFPMAVTKRALGMVGSAAWGTAKAGFDAVGAVGKAGLNVLGMGARGLGYAAGIRYESENEQARKEMARRRREAAGDFSKTDEDLANRKLKNLNLDQAMSAAVGGMGRIRKQFGLNRQDTLALQATGLLSSISQTLKKQLEQTSESEDPTKPSKRTKAMGWLKGLFNRKKDDDKKKDGEKDDDGMSITDIGSAWDMLKDAAKGGKAGLSKLKGLGGKLGGKLMSFGKVAAPTALGALGVGGLGGTAAAATTATAATGAAAATTAGAATASAATVGAGASIAAMAATAGGAIAAFLTSPVVISAAAAALVGYAAYKGYKYFTRGNLSALGKLRLVQYGFQPDNKAFAKKVFDLEQMTLEATSISSSGQVTIDPKKLKAQALLNAFDMVAADSNQYDHFMKWFYQRFRPVFTTHLTAAQAIAGKLDFNAVEDLKDEKRKQFIEAVAFPSGPYAVKELPVWPRGQLVPTNANDVVEAVKAALADLKESKKSVIQKAVEAAVPSAVAATQQSNAKRASATAMFDEPTAEKMALSVQASIGVTALSNGTRVDALEATRFKTYGLLELVPDKVNALRVLERLVAPRVAFNGRSGTASWNDDVNYLFARVSVNFGIVDTRGPDTYAWKTWFAKRFLPVYLNFQTAYNAKTGKLAVPGVEGALRLQHQLEVAKLIVATKGVWSVVDTPWPGYITSVSDELVKPNLAYLQDAAGKVVLDEQKKTAEAKKPAASPAQATVNPAAVKAADRWKSLIKEAGKQSAPDAEVPVSNASVASAAPTSAGTTPAMAGGPLSDGRNVGGYMSHGKDVNISGLNAQFRQQLFGAIEEYGLATGKTVNINDAWRSYEDQMARKRKHGARAAEPGTSLHEFGLAVDIDAPTLNAMDKLGLLRKYGLIRPVGGEPWHLEPIGIQDNLARYKEDQAAATEAVKNGIGRGGGGWGTIASAKRYSRNAEMARAIASSTGGTVADTPTGGAATIAAISENVPKGLQRSSPAGAKAVLPEAVPVAGGIRPSATEQVKRNQARAGGPGAYTPAGKTLIASNDAEFNSGKTGATPTGPGDSAFKVPEPKGSGIDGLRETIVGAAKVVGVDPDYLLQSIAVESDFNTNAANSNSTAKGIGQFTNGTWQATIRKYGARYGYDANTDPSDAKASALMAAHLLKDNLDGLRTQARPSVLDAYLAHMLGVSGANRFLSEMQKNPSAIAAQVLPNAANSNRSIFYAENGSPRTLAQVYADLGSRLRSKAKTYGLNDPVFDVVSPAAEVKRPVAAPSQGVSTMPQGSLPPRTAPVAPVRPPPAILPPVQMPTVQRDRAVVPNAANNYSPEILQSAATAIIEQLTVQRKILDVVQEIASRSKSDSSQATPAQSQPESATQQKPTQESYMVPKTPVPMKRYR